jgi:uncharacterized membrane protein YfcA
MEIATAGELTIIGLIGGILAGFLGIGGGVIIIPLLLYGAGMSLKVATGVSMVQAFFATLSGLAVHRHNRTIDLRLGLTLGGSGLLGALVGAFGSALLTSRALLIVYFFLLVLSLFLLLFAPRKEKPRAQARLGLIVPIGLAVGILAGMLGVGGGFIMIPLMISVLKIPTRVAIGSSLLVVLLTTLAGAAGKIATGQFDLQVAILVVVGSILGAQVGGRVNSKVSPAVIRTSLALLLFGIAVRTGIDLFAG